MKLDVLDALRYLGAGDCPPERARQEMVQVAAELTERLWPRYTYRVFSLDHRPEGILLKEAELLLPGMLAKDMLRGCGRAAVLVCTLGAEFDAMLRSGQVRDMAKAAMLNACGSALVEAGCNEVEKELAGRFPDLHLTDRFSPGYGDLPLSLQPGICAALDAYRRLGVAVSDTCLLNPVKTVTAIIGLADTPQPARIRGCERCALYETCSLRKGGNHCGTA
jgi:hypothetical protein